MHVVNLRGAAVAGRAAVACLALVGGLLAAPEPLRAFDELRQMTRPDGKTTIEVREATSTERFRVQSLLRDTGKHETPQDLDAFDNYFLYRIAEMTWNANHTLLPKKRAELKRDLISARAAKAQDLHDRANQMLLTELPKIALSDRFHPVVRVNAMLALGMLDKVEPDITSTAPGKGAEPLAAALPVLRQAAIDPQLPEAVRIAALVGIQHHAQLEMAATERRPTVDALVGLVKETQVGPGRSATGMQWMRMSAAQILGTMVDKWADLGSPAVAEALVGLIGDAQAPLAARCEAAYALGLLDARQLTGPAATAAPAALGNLLLEIIRAGEQAPAIADADGWKRYLDGFSYYCHCVAFAANGTKEGRGLKSAPTGDAKTLGADLGRMAGEVQAEFGKTRTTQGDLVAALATKRANLEKWLADKNLDAPTAPAAAQASTTKP